MKHLLNTLYVTTQGAYLNREGETVCVNVDREVKLRLPIHNLGGIICFGNVSMSPFLMGLCAENNVSVSFLTEYGKYLASVRGPVSGNVLLRKEQYRRSDDLQKSAGIAKVIVMAKIANARTALLRRAREIPGEDIIKSNLDSSTRNLAMLLDRLKKADDSLPLESIRGMEGDAGRTYFSSFDGMITAQKEDFFFHERSRRPPMDNVNALISFIYTLLMHDVRSALEAVGLDPAVGFLHRDRPGRPGLALDLMEEFRVYLADRLALTLINRQQIRGRGFTKTETGAVIMNDESRKELLVAYQKRKQEEILHPFLNEKIQIGLLPHLQAMLFARYLRGDLDGYPPFVWK